MALGVGSCHLDIGDVFQHAGGAVAAVFDLKQLGGVVDELGVTLTGLELGVVQNVGDEGDVGLYAADMHLVDGAGRLAAHPQEGVVPGGDLDQQGVVVGGDGGAGARVAAVQTDAEAAAGAVGGDPAGVGGEAVHRILGGHAALNGVAVDVHVVLALQADFRRGQGIALRDEHLGAHQVDAGDLLGDGVLHLDTGVHLDEVVVALLVHQEFHGAGGDVADALGDLDRVLVEGVQGGLRHAPGGGELHHLLIAALEGAVTLADVVDVAVLIRQDLHLDVLRLHQEFFNENVVVAEGLFGLALHQLEGGLDLLRGVAPAHTASAAAGGRLQDDGKAEANRLFQCFVPILQRFSAAGDDGHAAGDGRGLGGQLVAHLIQHLGGRPDEGDARRVAGAGEGGVLRQEAVAGVDGVHAATARQVDDAGDIQIGAKGTLIFADEVGLVRLGTEEGVGVFVGIHGHCVQPQVIAGPENADGDLAAVCGQHLVERAYCH